MDGNMDYESFFKQSVDTIKNEGRYRVFANLERQAGNYPYAINRRMDATENVVVWCSNDYLGMWQNKDILNSIKTTLDIVGAGSGGTRNISGTTKYHVHLHLLFLYKMYY